MVEGDLTCRLEILDQRGGSRLAAGIFFLWPMALALSATFLALLIGEERTDTVARVEQKYGDGQQHGSRSLSAHESSLLPASRLCNTILMAGLVVLPTPIDRVGLVRRGRYLEYLTLGSCGLEALVSIVAGLAAGSVALIGFGFDSLIEVTSGGAVLWRLHRDHDEASRELAERNTLRIVGWCFLALAIYVTYESAKALLSHEIPRPSLTGVLIALFSVVAMPILARAKRKVARALGSAALSADAKQTELCSYLSAILLGGLLLNALAGWWWADPFAALVMVPVIVKEGIGALRGKSCCAGACH
jgi:hypothetical protein